MKKLLTYWFWYYKFLYYIKKDHYFVIKRSNDNKEILDMCYHAMLYALKQHHKVRQTYDKYPYYFHLNEVCKIAIKYRDLVNNDVNTYIGSLLHDILEDTHLTYNDIRNIFGLDVAEIVFACTELKGRNRKERHGQEYLQGLKDNKLGLFVKLCDIIANMERGKITSSRMLNTYQKEYPNIKKELYNEEYKEMFDYIENNLL